ncbi:Hydrolase (plasmid) [Mesorhizobium loti]|uniref:hypothetical protein n=1 Tax=Mesorhizobium TaxID=68287 RepID=UPI0008199963|nr:MULTISPECIES: hypothetical protein [Mesorhizobium]BAV52724.1 Hydrolase [Mesorhizobium loti]BCH04911.1 hypothetical protein MesoLj131b_69100 [Mesorhizobium sp. 131-2-5]
MAVLLPVTHHYKLARKLPDRRTLIEDGVAVPPVLLALEEAAGCQKIGRPADFVVLEAESYRENPMLDRPSAGQNHNQEGKVYLN